MKKLALPWYLAFAFAAIAAFPVSSLAQTYAGAYAGIDGGYRWSNTDATFPSRTASAGGITFNFPASTESFSSSSMLLGGHLGYN